MPDEPNPRIIERRDHFGAGIGRCIIDHDDLVIVILLLAENAGQTIRHKWRHVVHGHNKSDGGRGFWSSDRIPPADHPRGHAIGQAMIRDVTQDHGARPDHTISPNLDPVDDSGPDADKAEIAHLDPPP